MSDPYCYRFNSFLPQEILGKYNSCSSAINFPDEVIIEGSIKIKCFLKN